MAEGRGGVVKKFLDHTTPSARTNEASRLFLIVQPPVLLLRRGADCCSFQSARQFGKRCLATRGIDRSGSANELPTRGTLYFPGFLI